MKCKMPSKFNITKEQVYTVIIFLLIVFWTVSSVLGIIGFARSVDPKDNVVSAKAETVDEVNADDRVYAILPRGQQLTVSAGNSSFSLNGSTPGVIYAQGYNGTEFDGSTSYFSVPCVVSYFGASGADLVSSFYTLWFTQEPIFTTVGAKFVVADDFYFRVPYDGFMKDLSDFNTIYLRLQGRSGYLEFILDSSIFRYTTVTSQVAWDEGYQAGILDKNAGLFSLFDSYEVNCYGTTDNTTEYGLMGSFTSQDLSGNSLFFTEAYEYLISAGFPSIEYCDDVEIVVGIDRYSSTFIPVDSFSIIIPVLPQVIEVYGYGFDSYENLYRIPLSMDPSSEYPEGCVLSVKRSSIDPSIDSPALKGFSFKFKNHLRLSNLRDLVFYSGDHGFNLGYTEGYIDGFQANADSVYDLGFEDGKVEGDKIGYNRGFNTGYNKALSTLVGDYTWDGLLSSLIDVPIQAFTGLFNFELLGVNLASFFFALLTVCVVLTIVKMIM